MRCPTVLTYKMNVLSAFLVYLFIKVKFVGLVNIVAGREVMPELLQFDLTSQSAVAKLLPLLDDTPQRQQMLSDFDEVIARLGDEPADTRAAKAVLELIGR